MAVTFDHAVRACQWSDAVVIRTRVAVAAGHAATALSRRLHLGEGTVIGGRVTMAVQPDALAQSAHGRAIALVSGTNGKSTTTALLAAATSSLGSITNRGGANLPGGLVAVLSSAPPDAPAVLEVDEGWLEKVATAVRPRVVLALNLTRDQLDRVFEVRKLAATWKRAFTHAGHVVANADDPLVAWAARGAPNVTWVAAGQPWRADAVGCPECEGAIAFSGDEWACRTCDFRRPVPDVTLDHDDVVAGHLRLPLGLLLPGRCNRANAAMVLAAARILGVPPDAAVAAMRDVRAVDGRYATVAVGDQRARLLLAKNPAGWLEVLDLLDEQPAPVVVAINSQIADGRDVSWLWDVPFERLAGRPVVASGERWRDLSVRLRYAGVEHTTDAEPFDGVRNLETALVDVAANYTAFRRLRAGTQ
jgi:UDP-N-acetylmuramyl tripeptide synthase